MASSVFRCGMLAALLAAGCGARTLPLADSDADGGPRIFEEVEVPGALAGDYAQVRIWALADDDVLVCMSDRVDERGGIGRFDGVRVVVERTGAPCLKVWGLGPDRAWAVVEDPETGRQRVLRRDGTSWMEEPIDLDEGCAFEAFYATREAQPMLVGLCSHGDEPVRWAFTQLGDSWALSAMWVPPLETMTEVLGAATMDWDTAFYGRGRVAADAIVVTGLSPELGYPAELAIWAGGEGLAGLVATDGDALYVRGATGAWTAHPCPPPLPRAGMGPCWSSAARTADGRVFLGGGLGSTGDRGSDDWRLHRWDGTSLRQVLAPCGGPTPHCSVHDVSTSARRLFAAVGRDWETTLLWAEVGE